MQKNFVVGAITQIGKTLFLSQKHNIFFQFKPKNKSKINKPNKAMKLSEEFLKNENLTVFDKQKLIETLDKFYDFLNQNKNLKTYFIQYYVYKSSGHSLLDDRKILISKIIQVSNPMELNNINHTLIKVKKL